MRSWQNAQRLLWSNWLSLILRGDKSSMKHPVLGVTSGGSLFYLIFGCGIWFGSWFGSILESICSLLLFVLLFVAFCFVYHSFLSFDCQVIFRAFYQLSSLFRCIQLIRMREIVLLCVRVVWNLMKSQNPSCMISALGLQKTSLSMWWNELCHVRKMPPSRSTCSTKSNVFQSHIHPGWKLNLLLVTILVVGFQKFDWLSVTFPLGVLLICHPFRMIPFCFLSNQLRSGQQRNAREDWSHSTWLLMKRYWAWRKSAGNHWSSRASPLGRMSDLVVFTVLHMHTTISNSLSPDL